MSAGALSLLINNSTNGTVFDNNPVDSSLNVII